MKDEYSFFTKMHSLFLLDAFKLKLFKNRIAEFEKHWPQLQISITNSNNNEPSIIPCKIGIDEAVAMAIKKIEGT